MQRITERDEFGNANIKEVDMTFLLSLPYEQMVILTKAFNKLADYEDKDVAHQTLNALLNFIFLNRDAGLALNQMAQAFISLQSTAAASERGTGHQITGLN